MDQFLSKKLKCSIICIKIVLRIEWGKFEIFGTHFVRHDWVDVRKFGSNFVRHIWRNTEKFGTSFSNTWLFECSNSGTNSEKRCCWDFEIFGSNVGPSCWNTQIFVSLSVSKQICLKILNFYTLTYFFLRLEFLNRTQV